MECSRKDDKVNRLADSPRSPQLFSHDNARGEEELREIRVFHSGRNCTGQPAAQANRCATKPG